MKDSTLLQISEMECSKFQGLEIWNSLCVSHSRLHWPTCLSPVLWGCQNSDLWTPKDCESGGKWFTVSLLYLPRNVRGLHHVTNMKSAFALVTRIQLCDNKDNTKCKLEGRLNLRFDKIAPRLHKPQCSQVEPNLLLSLGQ